MQMNKDSQVRLPRSFLTDMEKQYVRDHYHNTPVVKMATALKRGAATLYLFMDSENLDTFSSQPLFGKKRTPQPIKKGCFDHNDYKRLI